MTGTKAFDENVQDYEQWFVEHPLAYVSELHAVRTLLPAQGSGIEVGVGTGRFAVPLGLQRGIEPSAAMAEVARKKGIEVLQAVAENLPFKSAEFDAVLMVTTVCFLDDMDLAFAEAFRVLKPGGSFVVGFIDRESPIGREYLKRKDRSVFYKEATFYSVPEIVDHMKQAGFGQFRYCQTLFTPLKEMEAPDPVKEGYGQGSFAVVRGEKRL